MQTSNKSVIIILAAILIAAFFMPWLKFFVSLNAWDMIFGEAGRFINPGFKYVTLLIPITGILIVYGAAFNEENYPVSKGLLFRVPILTLIVLIASFLYKLNDSGLPVRGSDLGDIIQIFGIGFWLTLIAAAILPFMQSQPAAAVKTSPAKTTMHTDNTSADTAMEDAPPQ